MRVKVDDSRAVGKVADGARVSAAKAAVVARIDRDTKPLIPMMRNGIVKGRGKIKLVTTAGAIRRKIDLSAAKDGTIRWYSKVARNQYYGKSGWNYTTPGTGPRWVERAMAVHKPEWEKAAKEAFYGGN